MKILFIVPNIQSHDPMPCLSVAYLKSHINSKSKHDSKIFDLAFHKKNWKKYISEKIRVENPDVIGFSVLSFNYHSALQIAEFIKNKFNIKIIFGGIHVILSPDEVIQKPFIDIICTGEGEKVILDLLDNKINCKNIDGLWYKKNGKIIKNKKNKLIENLDKLDFPDFSDYDIEHYFIVNHNHFPIMGSRGCPFSCTYCSNHALRKKLIGKYVRFRSVDNIINEISLRINQYRNHGLKFFYFFDDTFILSKEFVDEFCTKYKENGFHKIVKWSANVRANLVTDEIIKTMKDAGCYEVRMGVESGNDYILNEIYNRNMTREQLLAAFEIIKRNNVQLRLDFIYGAPTETFEMMNESFDLAKKSNGDSVFFARLYPFPGTEIKKMCENENTISEVIDHDSFGMPPVEKTKYVSKKQLDKFKKIITRWQSNNYLSEGFRYRGLLFFWDIFVFLVYYKHRFGLEFNQIYRWNVLNYKFKNL